MGRPPSSGGPAFRFTQNEVVEMEACLQEVNNAIPTRETICALAEKFSLTPDRVGKFVVQPKQVWNWFQNRRYSQKSKVGKAPGKLSVTPMLRDDSSSFRNVAPPVSAPSGRNSMDNAQVEFEAKSARDGAWYDVSAFLSHRMFETGDPEVRVRFSGFGVEEDEWVNVRKCVRQRSLPCENAECVAVLPGDLILCFQEGKEQALYFDAHVLDAQRRRHDVRGCRCRFLVRYDHDQSEEIVPLRKVCRRPETDYRLQALQTARPSGSLDPKAPATNDPSSAASSNDFNMASHRTRRQRKLMDVNTDEVTTVPPLAKEPVTVQAAATVETVETKTGSDVTMEDAAAAADKPPAAAAVKEAEADAISRTNGATVFTPKRSAYSCIQMNGKEVFRFAVRSVPQTIQASLDEAGLAGSSIDWLLLHQANQRIIDAVATRLEIPSEKVISNLAHYGNTSAASIPLALDEAVRSGRVKAGDTIATAGFGAGLTWGSAVVRWG